MGDSQKICKTLEMDLQEIFETLEMNSQGFAILWKQFFCQRNFFSKKFMFSKKLILFSKNFFSKKVEMPAYFSMEHSHVAHQIRVVGKPNPVVIGNVLGVKAHLWGICRTLEMDSLVFTVDLGLLMVQDDGVHFVSQ